MFLATPNRTLMVAAKAVVAALFYGVSAAGMVIGTIVVGPLVAKPPVSSLAVAG